MKQTENGVVIEVRVRPNSKRFALYEKEGRLVLEVTSPPQEGKANLEIVKGLRRLFGKDVEIVSGLRSKDKVLLIRNAKMDELKNLIRS